MKAYKNHIICGVSWCTVFTKTSILCIVIGDVIKNWVKARVKYLCKFRDLRKENDTNNPPCSHSIYHTPALETCTETSEINMGHLLCSKSSNVYTELKPKFTAKRSEHSYVTLCTPRGHQFTEFSLALRYVIQVVNHSRLTRIQLVGLFCVFS